MRPWIIHRIPLGQNLYPSRNTVHWWITNHVCICPCSFCNCQLTRVAIPPQEYADTILAYARQDTEATLYPGPNYERLAGFLTSNNQSFIPSTYLSFPFFRLYPNATASPGGPFEATDPREVTRDPIYPSPSSTGVHLVFIRGQPSSEWLRVVGGTFRIDPEFFHRHLDFLSTAGRRNHYCLPSLPSTSNYIIQLRYFTICRPQSLSSVSAEITDFKRSASKKQMEAYTNKLIASIDKNDGTGNSIVRDYIVFNKDYSVIEQVISLCVTHVFGSWNGMFKHPLFTL